MDRESYALLRLTLTRGIGPTTCRRLLEKFATAQEVLKAKEKELLEAGLSARQVKSLLYSEPDVEKELHLAKENGVRLVSWDDKDYPHNLRFIYDPPPILYVKGELKPQDALAIAIVGSRFCTHYGQSQAERFAMVLGRVGFTIVSGLARGVDTSAHLGALKVGARTIAVIGRGLAAIYPRENTELAERISTSGAVVSEFPMLTPPEKVNFPPRNRLISGLSLGVVVIEAGQKSGSLITAHWAIEQGKEVFALPGQIDSPHSHGTHKLIKEGAKLVEDVSDILEELGPLVQQTGITESASERPPVTATNPDPLSRSQEVTALGYGDRTPKVGRENAFPPTKDVHQTKSPPLATAQPTPETPSVKLNLSPNEETILSLLSSKPKTIDEIIESSHLPAHVVSSHLTLLELKKLAKQLPGKRFVRG